MKAPERTTAEVFPRYVGGEVLADSATLKWPGLFVRRYRYSRVVDGFLVPATAEPLIACNIGGSAEFEERFDYCAERSIKVFALMVLVFGLRFSINFAGLALPPGSEPGGA